MDYTIVIKVKYGDTLRRFNARVDENEQFDFDISGLRAKVLGLFKLAPDADVTLTYTDEDGDAVALVDDDDLRDVMRQRLNPLRVNVVLNTDKGGRSYTRSSGSPTPMRSPQVQHPLPNNNIGVAEVREALTKLYLDLSKAASASPVLAELPVLGELVDNFSKMGQSYLNPVSQFQEVGEDSNTPSGASGSPIGPSMTKAPEASKDDVAPSKVLTNAQLVEPTSKSDQGVVGRGNVTRGVGSLVTAAPSSMDLSRDIPGDSIPSGGTILNLLPGIANALVDDKKMESKKESGGQLNGKSVAIGASTSSAVPLKHFDLNRSKTTDFSGVLSNQFPGDFGNSSASHFGLDPFNECPFTGMPLAGDLPATPVAYPRIHPFKRSYNHSDGMGGMFHKGVRCDSCGVHPITGPRFKSKVKENYDLCSICFSEMGNESDYIRMDRPVSYRHPWFFKGLYGPMQHPRARPPSLPHVLRGCGTKPSRPKVDSCFIRDVNVMDGTVMAPSTSFIKIWRMRNNGSFVWPRGTQLVWIGGDRFSDKVSVEMEIPADGLPVDKELDIAVDFTAPELPGRYISDWRMSLPTGQKFGQRVWVLIQVDASLKDTLCDSFHGLNLNLPPDSNGPKGPRIIDVNVEPMVDGSLPEPCDSNMATELVKPTVDEQPNKDQELNFPINDTLLVGNSSVSDPVSQAVPSSVSYPIIDLTEVVAPAVPSLAPSPVMDVPTHSEDLSGNSAVEQTLLKELEEMGFKQVDLNKEILRMNEYDLQQSVDDLCGVAEWDPILEELLEMGFCDEEVNKKLLMKNNGSIKRVVMDLIAGEKP